MALALYVAATRPRGLERLPLGAPIVAVAALTVDEAAGSPQVVIEPDSPRTALKVEEVIEHAALRSALIAVAQAERLIVHGTQSEARTARDELERAVSELASRPGVFGELLETLETRERPSERDTESLEVTYGAVRGWYWIALLCVHAGRAPDVVKSLSDVFVTIATADMRVAEFLARNAESVLATEPTTHAASQRDELNALRMQHPGRAGLIDRLLLAACSGGPTHLRIAVANRLVLDPSDVAAVARGLTELFGSGAPWSALDVAGTAFETADGEGRVVLACAVVRTAPPEMAVAFVLERGDALDGAAQVWLELGQREGTTETLELAYADSRASDGDPEVRRRVVAALGRGDPGLLREAAGSDPDAIVRARAALALTARADVDVTGDDMNVLCDVLRGVRGDALGTALWAADNAFVAIEGRGAPGAHTRLVEQMTELVLDATRPLDERRRVLSALEPQLATLQLAWLESVVEE